MTLAHKTSMNYGNILILLLVGLIFASTLLTVHDL